MSDTLLLAIILLIMASTAYVASRLMRLRIRELLLGLIGAVMGLLLGALLSVPLGKLPTPYGGFLPIIATLVVTLIMISVALGQRSKMHHLTNFFKHWIPQRPAGSTAAAVETPTGATTGEQILVDTSVIIDGRISDIAKAGFVPGRLLVPRFVLAELQNIADSDEAMRRGRGRRGLEMLNNIQSTEGIEFQVIDDDVESIKEVDAKLVALAQRLGAKVLTTDFNLNRVAQIQGVRVLNINELANAIRPVVLPGEEMLVKVVQAGKERGQGVGYLPDGTMIVVENGDKLIGQEVATEVTRVFQTVAGKMIFTAPRKNHATSAKTATKTPRRQGRQINDRTNSSDNSPQAIEDRLIQETSGDDL